MSTFYQQILHPGPLSVISLIEHKEAYTSYDTLYPPHIFNQSVTTNCSEIIIMKANNIPLARKV